MIDKIKEFYEIAKQYEKYLPPCAVDFSKLTNKLFELELIDLGWPRELLCNANPDYFALDDYGAHSALQAAFFDGNRRRLTNTDTGKQPKNEFLLCIGFSTGAYYFGDDYDTEFFGRFFDELLELKPDYTDKLNKNIYFKKERAGDAIRSFVEIKDKYFKKLEDRKKELQIQRLQKELAVLTGEKNEII